MKHKKYLSSLFLVLLTFGTIGIVIWFTKSPHFPLLNVWVQNNYTFYLTGLYLVKVIGIVWPPLSGGIFTVASIPFLGWKLAFIIDLLGSATGSVITYYLGFKYGYKFLKKVLGNKFVEKIKSLKIKKGKEIIAVFMYKIIFGNVIVEVIYYGAGVLKINFKKFLIGSLSAHVLTGIPSFYFANNIFSGQDVLVTLVLIVLGIIFVVKTKGRYFE